MKKLILLTLVSAICAFSGLGQGTKTPQFAAYPATIEKSRARSINFHSNPGARTMRTRLSDGLKGGVNFAGHYIVVGWGCGTGCVSGAVIDARTGNVFWPEQFNAFAVLTGGGNYTDKAIDYKKNSRLLVIRGIPGSAHDDDPDKPSGIYYYEWKNNKLRQIRFVPKPME